jgi:hypothetical protein
MTLAIKRPAWAKLGTFDVRLYPAGSSRVASSGTATFDARGRLSLSAFSFRVTDGPRFEARIVNPLTGSDERLCTYVVAGSGLTIYP